MLEVTGTAAAIERTFFVPLNVYARLDGTAFYSPAFDPSVNLAVPLRFVTGLDNFAIPHPQGQRFDCGLEYSCPGTNVLRDIYLPCIGTAIDGTRQTIALLESSSYYPHDISDYLSLIGKASANVIVVPVPRDAGVPPLPGLTEGACPNAVSPGSDCFISPELPIPPRPMYTIGDGGVFDPLVSPGGPWVTYVDAAVEEREVALDIEMALTIAPGATILVYEQDLASWDPDLMLAEMADDDLAEQISSSAGLAHSSFTRTSWMSSSSSRSKGNRSSGLRATWAPTGPVCTGLFNLKTRSLTLPI